MKIKEIIVVEGRDDTDAVKKSVDAVTIETHGYGITKDTWNILEKAYRETGLIIFTDPDDAGRRIRRRLTERFPEAKEAFINVDDAGKDGDIGIENASAEAIRCSLQKARCGETGEAEGRRFTMDDMMKAGLTGQPDASRRRNGLGRRLGIGYANSKTFLQRLNKFGITKEEFYQELREI